MQWPSLFLFLLLLSCSSNVTRIDDAKADRLLNFVHDGQSKRVDLTARLGAPRSTFEENQIVIYLVEDDGGGLNVRTVPENARYHLVLVFNADQVLERHSLISVR